MLAAKIKHHSKHLKKSKLSMLLDATNKLDIDAYDSIIKIVEGGLSDNQLKAILRHLIVQFGESNDKQRAAFAKHILNSVNEHSKRSILFEALKNAFNNKDRCMVRVLSAYCPTMTQSLLHSTLGEGYHDFDGAIIAIQKETRCIVYAMSKIIKTYQKLDSSDANHAISIPTNNELKELIAKAGPGNGRFVSFVHNQSDLLIDFIEAKFHQGLEESEQASFNILTGFVVLINVAKGSPDRVLDLFYLIPDLTDLQDADGRSLMTILLEPLHRSKIVNQESDYPRTQKKAVIIKFIKTLYETGYDFDKKDTTGKSARDLLEEKDILSILQAEEPYFIVEKVIQQLKQNDVDAAKQLLLKAMNISFGAVNSHLESLCIHAHSDAENATADNPATDFSYLPTLVECFLDNVKANIHNTIFMHLLAIKAPNETNPNIAFSSKVTKAAFFHKHQSHLLINSGWADSKDFSNERDASPRASEPSDAVPRL